MIMQIKLFKLASKSESCILETDITFSDKPHIGNIDSPESLNIRDRLKRIRSENPRLYKAFRTGSFD